MNKRLRHDLVVSELVKRLILSNNYSSIDTFVEYENETQILGEIDILATRHSGRRVLFEVKGHHCSKGHAYAREQLQRYKDNHLHDDRYVYVSPEKCKRIYLL